MHMFVEQEPGHMEEEPGHMCTHVGVAFGCKCAGLLHPTALQVSLGSLGIGSWTLGPFAAASAGTATPSARDMSHLSTAGVAQT